MYNKTKEKRKIRQNLADTTGVTCVQKLFVPLRTVRYTPYPGSMLQPWHAHPRGYRSECINYFV